MVSETVTPEPCTSEARRLRHYSIDLKSDRHAPRQGGRGGRTLCGVPAQDEERANWWLAKWTSKRITLADLAPCKKCVRKAGISA